MRVGLIGTGRIGQFHARVLRESPLVEALTLTDADPALAARVAESVGAQCVDSAESVLESGIDALVIAAATPAHARLLHMAADSGLPVFCEKPIALDLETTDEVIAHVERAGIMVQVGFQRRFDAGHVAARAAVSSGALGAVHLVRLATHDPKPPPETFVAASGGMWRDQTIHEFDSAQWVLGQRVVEVFAEGRAGDDLFARHDDIDVGCAVLSFDGGTLGVLTAARHDALGYDVRMEVYGLKDSVVVGWDQRTPLRSIEPGADAPAGPAYSSFIERFAAAYRSEMNAFLDAVRDRSESPCTVKEARSALVVALAADRSRREHRPVAVNEVR